ncbi:hypothetical protein Droror1_Dr00024471, partial [Drosera rotundifolia]
MTSAVADVAGPIPPGVTEAEWEVIMTMRARRDEPPRGVPEDETEVLVGGKLRTVRGLREKVEILVQRFGFLLVFVELQPVKDIVSWSSMVASFGKNWLGKSWPGSHFRGGE